MWAPDTPAILKGDHASVTSLAGNSEPAAFSRLISVKNLVVYFKVFFKCASGMQVFKLNPEK